MPEVIYYLPQIFTFSAVLVSLIIVIMGRKLVLVTKDYTDSFKKKLTIYFITLIIILTIYGFWLYDFLKILR